MRAVKHSELRHVQRSTLCADKDPETEAMSNQLLFDCPRASSYGLCFFSFPSSCKEAVAHRVRVCVCGRRCVNLQLPNLRGQAWASMGKSSSCMGHSAEMVSLKEEAQHPDSETVQRCDMTSFFL